MKVSREVVEARRERLASILQQHQYLPVRDLCRLLGVSEATIRRDLDALEKSQQVKRTFGGALAEFNDRFPSFKQRQLHNSAAKAAIARQVARLVPPGITLYLDVGTTLFAVAQALHARPPGELKVVTGNLPAAELLAENPSFEVYLMAGKLLPRQSSLLGETATQSISFWHYDLALLCCEGANEEGLWNSREEIVVTQNAVLRRSGRVVLCLEQAKLGRTTPYFLCPWSSVHLVVSDQKQGETTNGRPGLPSGVAHLPCNSPELPDLFLQNQGLTLPVSLL